MANENEKKDFITRRVEDFTTLVGLMTKDAKTTLMTISLIVNFWLGHKVIKRTEDFTQVIIEEVRRQSKPLIKEETSKQLTPYKDKIDTTINEVREVIKKTDKLYE